MRPDGWPRRPGRRGLRAAVEWSAVGVALTLLATSGLVYGTAASLAGQLRNPGNVYATTALVAPTGLSATPAGPNVDLAWAAGVNGSGYAVLGLANGTSPSCPAGGYAALGASPTTTYVDSGRRLPQGTWYCYQVETSYDAWTSVQNNPLAAAQIGFVANSVKLVNAGDIAACSGSGTQTDGQSGYLECGDQVVIGFNQPVAPSSGPAGTDSVCADLTDNTIELASTTTSGGCSATETLALGTLTGGTLGNKSARFDASYAWSNGDQTLTVTIGTRTSGNKYPTVSTSTWTLTPTTTTGALLSATGGDAICASNSGGGDCLPATASASTF